VGGHGKQIDAEFFNISGNMPCRLHRIGMKIDARFFGDFTYITDRLDGTTSLLACITEIMMVFPVIAFLTS